MPVSISSAAIQTDVTTLLGRLTAARAALFDNIPAGTMPLASAVSAIPTAHIASIQYFSIAFANTEGSKTATITAVNTGKAFVVWLGFSTADGVDLNRNHSARLTLTNSTTVTATRQGTANDVTVNGVVVEFV